MEESFVVIVGTVIEGLTFYGPFTQDEAEDFGATAPVCQEEPWVATTLHSNSEAYKVDRQYIHIVTKQDWDKIVDGWSGHLMAYLSESLGCYQGQANVMYTTLSEGYLDHESSPHYTDLGCTES